jgi:hypothetical protein
MDGNFTNWGEFAKERNITQDCNFTKKGNSAKDDNFA